MEDMEPRYSALERYRAAEFWLTVAEQYIEAGQLERVLGAIRRVRSALDDGDRSMALVAMTHMGDGGAA